MIKNIEEKIDVRPEINLLGPEGNAFVLMGYADQWSRQMGFKSEKKDAIIKDMMSGDYEHLLSVLEEHFGEHVIFYR